MYKVNLLFIMFILFYCKLGRGSRRNLVSAYFNVKPSR